MSVPRIYLCSATGALTTDAAPVGGGVAVLETLIPHLERAGFEITLLTPSREDQRDGIRQTLAVPTLSAAEPERILQLDARQYARFALEWETALDRYFADIDPTGAVVLANDTSEGPPFAALQQRGFRQIALLHVIVADFFARRYLSQPTGLPIQARYLAALWRAVERSGLAHYAPGIAKLVWAKEAELAQYVDAPIVPSAPLARTLSECYPQTGVERRVEVIPWGVVGPAQPSRRQHRRAVLRDLGADVNRFTLLTLSRISPEKRIELALDALELIERESPVTAAQIQLIVAGAPAYMGGHAYRRRLQRQARRLRAIPVHFSGYVADEAKWNLFAACAGDLAVFCGAHLHRQLSVPPDQVADIITDALAQVFADNHAPPDAGPDYPRLVRAEIIRVQNTPWAQVQDDESCFARSPDALVHWAPIDDSLKTHDAEIVRNSLSFRWKEVRDKFRRQADPVALRKTMGLE